jgi:hypothetical protein
MILVRRLFRFSGRSADVSRDVESELRFHLDMRAQELMEAGMGPQAEPASPRSNPSAISAASVPNVGPSPPAGRASAPGEPP